MADWTEEELSHLIMENSDGSQFIDKSYLY
jgi:hypothetical protein